MTNFPDTEPRPQASDRDSTPKPNRSTGPTSTLGKEISSLNALKHGLRSQKLVLRHEDPLEFEMTVRGWFEQYHPDTPVALTLVEETAKAHWFFKRAEKRLESVEWELPANAYHWTEEHHRLFRNFHRYKTAAERSFFKFFNALEVHYDRHRRSDLQKEQARISAARVDLGWARLKELQAQEADKVEQHVEVEMQEEGCVTMCVPSNQELAAELAARPEPPALIVRKIHFAEGVPGEYHWADPTPHQRMNETRAKQTLPYSDWLRGIEEEAASGTGHIAPLARLQFSTR